MAIVLPADLRKVNRFRAFELMRVWEEERGEVISEAAWLHQEDWANTVISRRGDYVRLVLLDVKQPGQGAFRRLVEGILAAGLKPVVIEPFFETMPAILQKWGWVKQIKHGEERWHPPAKTWRQTQMLALFQHCTVPYGDKLSRGLSITCGKCSRVEQVHVNTLKQGSGDDSDKALQLYSRKFEELGWHVGNSPSRHRCPACVARASQMRFVHANKQTTDKGEEPVSATVVDIAKNQAPHAEPPREMSRDDRRIIFAKLQEAYDNETTGYRSGWTDERVAVDLGVPLAWVKEMRVDYFGPVGSNPEIDQLIEEARGWRAELVSMAARAEQLLLETRKCAGKGDYIERRLAELLKAVGR